MVWLGLSSIWTELVAQPEFHLNGSTIEVAEGCYRLTSDEIGNDVGSLWCAFPINLDNAFEIQLAVNFGCSPRAGEGVAFLMHTNSSAYNALGCKGDLMGYGRSSSCEGIQPSLAVEMDTKFTKNQKDSHEPHLAIVQNGDLSQPVHPPVPINDARINVLDCEYHSILIKWLPSKQELTVYYHKDLRLTYKRNLVKDIFNGQHKVYFGFTGSTGDRANMQVICIQNVIMELDPNFDNKKQDFENAINIYPNSLKKRLTIDVDLDEEEYLEIQLYNSAGDLIYEIPTHLVQENQYFFNLPNLPSDVYYVTVSNGEYQVTKKIVHVDNTRA